MNTINISLLVISLCIFILALFVYISSFKNDKPHCDRYILNVYLYFLLGLLLIVFTILSFMKKNIPITGTKSLIGFIIAIGLIITLVYIPPKSVLLNHLLWVALMVSIAVMMYSTIRYKQEGGYLTSALIGTIIIFSCLTLLVWIKPELVKLSWGSGLTVSLLALILAWFLPMLFTKDNKNTRLYYTVLIWITMIVIGLLVLYDTKLIREKAKVCVLPNYPADSLGLIIDFINLFNLQI